jgi:hypothetical protein
LKHYNIIQKAGPLPPLTEAAQYILAKWNMLFKTIPSKLE